MTTPNNVEIIKTFLTKMSEQDNRHTAAPFYYVIRTEKEVPAYDGFGDVKYHYGDEAYESEEEIIQYLEDNGYDEKEIEKEMREVQEFWVTKEWAEKGMFLTEEDAKLHLKKNHYHYSSNAHTYVNHAWRAPYLEEFLNALFDHFEIKRQKK